MIKKIRNLMRRHINLLHPQWLILRDEDKKRREIAQLLIGTVLDIGCGHRQMEHFLRSNTTYIGLDYPTTHVKGYSGCPDIFGDGQCLPFRAESFDAVIALDVLEHLPSPERCVRESARVLRSGGQLILQTPFLYPLHDIPYDFQRWTMPGLEALVQHQGFEINERRTFGAPCETAAALNSISMAKAILNSISGRSPAIMLAPFFLVLIPITNLFGWLLAQLLPADDFMPLGYRLVCTKTS